METEPQQRGGGKKKKKQAAKKKKAEESLHAREVQQLEALDAELAQKEEVGSANIESKVTQSTSRNDDSEIDDDDVPSELLPVNWRNPALDVDTEIEHPPDIAVPIPGEAVASLKDSSQPEQSKELILENPEQYFEDPFSPAVESEDESLVQTPSGPEVSSGSDARESPSPRRESLKYVSAWGHMASVTNSDDEFESTEPSVAAATGGEEAAVVSQVLSRSEILEEVALEQWVKDSLKDIPSFVDTALAAFSEQKISSVASLVKENLGVKGLKQLGLPTPAAWALHSAVEKIRTVGSSCVSSSAPAAPNTESPSSLPPSSSVAPVDTLIPAPADPAIAIDDEIVIAAVSEGDQASNDKDVISAKALSENSSKSKKIWGYALEGSSSESDREEEGKETKTGDSSSSWRQKFVVMDSSSSDEGESEGQ